ncbi:hypothetical protein [Aeromicrobium sp. NPDC092404]|uniref:hypothetical protein n=1 Tax=Aeromicrobium sp. NPDC092404 TaxID=3154976 RepID=UPI00342F02A6
MDRSTAARLGIAGAVAGAGLAAGGIAIASAGTSTETPSSVQAHPGGHRGDHGQMAETLAEELGLTTDAVQKALDAVREDPRPSKATDGSSRPAPPTEAERTERRAALVTALAKELDVSEAKVKAALAVVDKQVDADRRERRTELRADLVTRLDDAVEAGTLTSADKTSVLKAYDAELIGGFGGGPGGHGFGGR